MFSKKEYNEHPHLDNRYLTDYELEHVLIYLSYHAKYDDKQLFTLENAIRVK